MKIGEAELYEVTALKEITFYRLMPCLLPSTSTLNIDQFKCQNGFLQLDTRRHPDFDGKPGDVYEVILVKKETK